MADVRLEQLTKHYKRGNEVIRALDGVTLTIGKAEFVAVVGRSGSGKTTMLDLMGLLLRPTSGQLVEGGAPCEGQQPAGGAPAFRVEECRLAPDAGEHLLLAVLPLRARDRTTDTCDRTPVPGAQP